jgi:hypothetical protein
VSDLGRGLFSFEFPAQIETSASREVTHIQTYIYTTQIIREFKLRVILAIGKRQAKKNFTVSGNKE